MFKLKAGAFIDDLTKKNTFGRVKARLYSVEWQKRGLAHVHMLLWMEHIVDQELIYNITSAEIPDKTKEPKLFDIVVLHDTWAI